MRVLVESSSALNAVPYFAILRSALPCFMPSDDERLRFLEQFKLTTAWDDEEWTLFFRDKSVAWLYGKVHVISKGKTLTEAVDAAIQRYNRKHGITTPEVLEPTGVHWLQVRGWVS